VVAVSERLAGIVRDARRRQLRRSAVAIAGGAAVAVAAAGIAGLLFGCARNVAVFEAAAFGALLALGAFLRPRQLETGSGIAARDAGGKLAPAACARGVLILIPNAFRDLVEGVMYAPGFAKADPAAELAAWIALALSEPHGPGPGVWVSLEGVGAAGLFNLPEELGPALAGLRRKGWIEVDRSRYPPLVRLLDGGREFVEGLVGG
jgi:hypothetical protein